MPIIERIVIIVISTFCLLSFILYFISLFLCIKNRKKEIKTAEFFIGNGNFMKPSNLVTESGRKWAKVNFISVIIIGTLLLLAFLGVVYIKVITFIK